MLWLGRIINYYGSDVLKEHVHKNKKKINSDSFFFIIQIFF